MQASTPVLPLAGWFLLDCARSPMADWSGADWPVLPIVFHHQPRFDPTPSPPCFLPQPNHAATPICRGVQDASRTNIIE